MAKRGKRSGPGFAELRSGALTTGQFAPVYVLVGEDQLRIEGVVEAMQKKVLDGPSASFNSHVLRGDQTSWNEVLQKALGFPMFGGRQVVWVRNLEELDKAKDEAGIQSLMQYFEKPAESTLLILSGEKVDGRRAWVGLARKLGYFFSFEAPSGRDLMNWIDRAAQRAGLNLAADGQRVLADLVGSDLHALRAEIEKLALIAESRGRDIDARELPGLVMDQAELDTFLMTDQIAEGLPADVLATWWRLRTWGADTYSLSPLVMSHLRRVALNAAASRDHVASADAIGRSGLNRWLYNNKLAPHAQRLGPASENLLATCLRCESAQKSRPLPPDLAFEQLLLDVSAGESR
jgi:DNA polymerase-3 subunit delta